MCPPASQQRDGPYRGDYVLRAPQPPQQECTPSSSAEPVVNKIEVSPHHLAVWFHGVYGGDVQKSLLACGDNINETDAKQFAEKFLMQKQYWRHLRLREFFATALMFESQQAELNDFFSTAGLTRALETNDAQVFAKKVWSGEYTDPDKDPERFDWFWHGFKTKCLGTDVENCWGSGKSSSDDTNFELREKTYQINKGSRIWRHFDKTFLDENGLHVDDMPSEKVTVVLGKEVFVKNPPPTVQDVMSTVKDTFVGYFARILS